MRRADEETTAMIKNDGSRTANYGSTTSAGNVHTRRDRVYRNHPFAFSLREYMNILSRLTRSGRTAV